MDYFFQDKANPKNEEESSKPTDSLTAQPNPSVASFQKETDPTSKTLQEIPRFNLNRTSPNGTSTLLTAPSLNRSTTSLVSISERSGGLRTSRSSSSFTRSGSSSDLNKLSTFTPHKLGRTKSSQSITKYNSSEKDNNDQTQADEMRGSCILMFPNAWSVLLTSLASSACITKPDVRRHPDRKHLIRIKLQGPSQFSREYSPFIRLHRCILSGRQSQEHHRPSRLPNQLSSAHLPE